MSAPLDPVGEALIAVFVCFLLLLAGQLYCCSSRRHRRKMKMLTPWPLPQQALEQSEASLVAHHQHHPTPSIYLLCCKHTCTTPPHSHSQHLHSTTTTATTTAIATTVTTSATTPPPQLVAKLLTPQTPLDPDLDILQLIPPPRFLFTIKEESIEDPASPSHPSKCCSISHSSSGNGSSFLTPPFSPLLPHPSSSPDHQLAPVSEGEHSPHCQDQSVSLESSSCVSSCSSSSAPLVNPSSFSPSPSSFPSPLHSKSSPLHDSHTPLRDLLHAPPSEPNSSSALHVASTCTSSIKGVLAANSSLSFSVSCTLIDEGLSHESSPSPTPSWRSHRSWVTCDRSVTPSPSSSSPFLSARSSPFYSSPPRRSFLRSSSLKLSSDLPNHETEVHRELQPTASVRLQVVGDI